MWLIRYPYKIEITYDHGSEFLDQKFKILIENKSKKATLGNFQVKYILESLHQVLGETMRMLKIQYDYKHGWNSTCKLI